MKNISSSIIDDLIFQTINCIEKNDESFVWYKTGTLCFTSSELNSDTFILCRYTEEDSGITKVSLAKLDINGRFSSNPNDEIEVTITENEEIYLKLDNLYNQILKRHYIIEFEENSPNYVENVA